MRKTTAESTESQQNRAATAKPTGKSGLADRNWRPIACMGVILLLAAIVRVAFSIGISAGSDFALSGGTQSSNNLRFIESIVSDGKIRFTDNWLNYPNGSVIVVPVVFDFIMALFAFVFNVFIDDSVTASSLALALSGPVFGVLACIPMFLLGREMFSSRLAGYLAAAYLALCPVFVEESVFSNGAGTSFTVFLLLFGILFLVKALKTLQDPKAAYKTAAFAGLFTAGASLSWIGFRGIAIPLVVVMVLQVLIDRFKGKDPRPAATVHSLVVSIGVFLPGIVYTVVGYWDLVASGTVVFSALAICFVQAYAWTARKPWTLMLPLYSIVFIAILGAIAVLSPGLCECIFSGNSIYAPEYASTLGREYLSLSRLAMYYGVVTYWFVFLVCLYMAYRFLANSSSALYTFTLVWLFAMTLTCGHNAAEAAIAAPVFALGFAALSAAVLKRVDLKAYFSGIKTGSGKVRVRRILNPIPLLTVLTAVLLVAAPNMMQVVDAGISSNEVDDYNDAVSNVFGSDRFGSLEYYVKTTDSWTVSEALGSLSGDGAVVTWMSYSDDVKIHANMKSFTDGYGNGADVASNILLANGVNGSSAAALLITSIIKLGMDSSTKSRLSSCGFSDDDIALIENVLDDADHVVDGTSVRDRVMTDYETYGSVDSSISDLNIKYLFLSDYLMKGYHSYQLTGAYDALGLRNPYIMVSSDMMPFFYGYSGIFDEMALLNGYSVDYSNGTVGKFTTFGYYAYYYGVYNFTDAMYDTLLYRTFIGMAPEEAGFTSLYDYIVALSAADETVQMHPGFGLSNYEVAYWKAKYNPDPNAESGDSGWVLMDAVDAIEKQRVNGGLINYLCGHPVILGYSPNSTGNEVSGYVKDSSDAGVKDVRVSAVGPDGVVRAMTHTSDDGSFKLFVKDVANTTLVYHAGAGYSSKGGVLIGTGSASAPGLANADVKADVTLSVPGIADLSGFTSTMTNNSTKDVITDDFSEVPYGVYKVSVKKGTTEVASGTLNITGDGAYVLAPNQYTYTVTVKNIYGAPLASEKVRLKGDFAVTPVDTDSNGVATFVGVPKGSYDISVDGYHLDKTTVSISSNTSKSITVRPAADYTITAPAGATVFIAGDAFSTSYVSTGSDSITLPRSTISDTAYTIYAFHGGSIWTGVTGAGSSVTLSENVLMTVTGTLKDSDGDRASGSIAFFDGAEKYVYSTDDDGIYTAYLPKKDMKVYATDSDDAFFGSVSEGESVSLNIEMDDADRIYTSSIYWSSVYYSDLMLKVVVTDPDATEYEFQIATDGGKYEFHLPRGSEAKIDALLNSAGEAFFGSVASGSVDDDHSADKNVSISLSTEKKLTVVNDTAIGGDVNLSIGGTKKEINEWSEDVNAFKITSSKTIVLESDDKRLYYDGKHYFDESYVASTINLSELLGLEDPADLDGITYNTVTIGNSADPEKSYSDYSIKVLYEGKVVATVTGGDPVRIGNEESGDYLLHIVKDDESEVLYLCAPVGDIAEDLVNCISAASVSGYVGSTVSTDMEFIDGSIRIPVSVKDGKYSVVLERGKDYQAKLDAVVSKVSYEIDEIVNFAEETGVRNFAAGSSPVMIAIAPEILEDAGAIKKVKVTIPATAVKNTTENIEKFTFSTGTAWMTPSFSMGSNVCDGVNVPANGSASEIVFIGYYNSNIHDLGTESLKISIDGSTDAYAVKLTGYAGDSGRVYVNKVSDVVGDYAYSYTYEIVNTGSAIRDVSVALTGAVPGPEWLTYYGVTDYIGTTVTNSISSIKAAPGTTTFSVSFMKASDETADIPDVTVVFGNIDDTTTPGDIAIDSVAGTATSEAEAESAVVTATSMSASGRGVVNDKGSVPTIVWVMGALIVLLVILIFWMASKRGVFARRK